MKLSLNANVTLSSLQTAKLGAMIAKRITRIQEPVNRAMAIQFRQCVYDNFGSSGAFRPHQWAMLSPAYARKVKRTYATLFVTGRLKSSIKAGATLERGRVSISNADAPYALAHQFGYPEGNLPDRPYFPILGGKVLGPVRFLVVLAARLALKIALK